MPISNDSEENNYYINYLNTRDSIKNEIDFPEISKLNNDWKNLINSQIKFNIKDYSKSKELAVSILEHKDETISIIIAETYNILGRIARLYKLNDDAKAFYESSVTYFKNSNSDFGTFGILRLEFNQANILLLNSDLSKALKAYDNLIYKTESLTPIKNLEKEYNKLLAKIFQNKALTLLYQGKTEESKNSFERALIYISSVPEESVKADLFLNYSNLALVQEDFDYAYELLSKASELYQKLGKRDLFGKIEIDKIKINLMKNIDNTIDLDLITSLKNYYEIATGKEVNLRIIEICELLFSRGRIDEARDLLIYLSKKEFLPDYKARIIFIDMNISLIDENYEKAIKLGNELLELTHFLNDEQSEIAVKLNLLRANYMIKKDNNLLFNGLKGLNEKLIKRNEIETAIQNYEQYFPILFEDKDYSVIIKILTDLEGSILKKIKDKNVKRYNNCDLLLINALLKESKAKKIYHSIKLEFNEILNTTRFKKYITDNPQFEKEIKEFLEIA